MSLLRDSDTSDRPLSEAELMRAADLSMEDLDAIDRVLLSRATDRWRKMAFLVAGAVLKFRATFPELPDVFYADRVRRLIESGTLASQGDVTRMRFSEVRLADSGSDSGQG